MHKANFIAEAIYISICGGEGWWRYSIKLSSVGWEFVATVSWRFRTCLAREQDDSVCPMARYGFPHNALENINNRQSTPAQPTPQPA